MSLNNSSENFRIIESRSLILFVTGIDNNKYSLEHWHEEFADIDNSTFQKRDQTLFKEERTEEDDPADLQDHCQHYLQFDLRHPNFHSKEGPPPGLL